MLTNLFIVLLFLKPLKLSVSETVGHTSSSVDNNLAVNSENGSRLLVLTVATEDSPALHRYLRSASLNGLRVHVLGQGAQWTNSLQNVNLVKSKLEQILNSDGEDDPIVMYTNSYTTILIGNQSQIIHNFKATKARILFSAESRRNSELPKNLKYPSDNKGVGYHFLNSGAYIGYASSIYNLLSSIPISDADSGAQHYFTKIYLNRQLRSQYGIKLDRVARIFQNVDQAWNSIGSCKLPASFWQKDYRASRLYFKQVHPYGILQINSYNADTENPKLVNTLYHTKPSVLLSDTSPIGLTVLNYFGNYFCPNLGLGSTNLTLLHKDNHEVSTVLIAIFIPRPIPFLKRFFEKIVALEYPKDKIHLYIYNGTNYADNHKTISEFIENHGKSFAGIQVIKGSSFLKEWDVRNMAVSEALRKQVKFYLNLDAEARITNPLSIQLLIQQNLPVVSPLLRIPYNALISNYHGALNKWGKRAIAKNYNEVVKLVHKGVWNVPCVNQAYLVNMTSLINMEITLNYTESNNGIYCVTRAFNKGVWPFYLTNQFHLGYSVTPKNFQTQHFRNELYQIKQNRYDWEQSYLHPQWRSAVKSTNSSEEPCRDVYWFPLVSQQFCTEMIELMENHGNWSVGTNYNASSPDEAHPNPDPYPTVDIDVEQVGFYDQWLEIARSYVTPLRRRVFGGFIPDPPVIETTIVIRYRPEEQSSNQPHHDHSTYTINLALNKPQRDFEGGGCRFLRHNCSVTDGKVGWILMHPGDLTHYHEGMSTTKGVRYILVSFIDPRNIEHNPLMPD